MACFATILRSIALPAMLAAGSCALSGAWADGPASASDGHETPIPRRVKDLEVTLLGIRTDLSGRDLRSPAVGKELRWARIDLRLAQDGEPSRLWLPQGVEIRAGNRRLAPKRLVTYFHEDGTGCLAFPDPRLGAPTDWQVSLEFARSPRYLPYDFWNVFRPEELWTIPQVPVPPPTASRRAARHPSVVIREGVKLRLVEMSGARAAARRGLVKQPAPAIRVRYSPAPRGLNVTLVRATDFKGRLLAAPTAPVPLTPAPTGQERSVVFPLKTQPDSRVVNATFAVHHSRFINFTARPERATASSALARNRGLTPPLE